MHSERAGGQGEEAALADAGTRAAIRVVHPRYEVGVEVPDGMRRQLLSDLS